MKNIILLLVLFTSHVFSATEDGSGAPQSHSAINVECLLRAIRDNHAVGSTNATEDGSGIDQSDATEDGSGVNWAQYFECLNENAE